MQLANGQYKQDKLNLANNFNSDVDKLNNEIANKELMVFDLQQENGRLMDAYTSISTDSAVVEIEKVETDREIISELIKKTSDYKKSGVDVKEAEAKLGTATNKFIDNESAELRSLVTEINGMLEKNLAIKKEADTKKALSTPSAPVASNVSGGYSRITVETLRGNFVTDIIMADLNSTQVITVTGNDGNCENNCNVKSLADYVAEVGGFAGINGSYFCPPDYPACSGKVNSYDFPVYSTRDGKWINPDKLFWNGRGMAGFVGSSPRFCTNANACDSGGVSAGIINYPSLINGGNIVVDQGSLPASLTQTKGLRGAIGVRGSYVYIMHVRNASVLDAAEVMKKLGIDHGLNLDGGGSAALYYNGGYKIGPGRLLPNAIVLKSR